MYVGILIEATYCVPRSALFATYSHLILNLLMLINSRNEQRKKDLGAQIFLLKTHQITCLLTHLAYDYLKQCIKTLS